MAAEISRNAVAANLNPSSSQNAEQGTVVLAKSFYTLPSGAAACVATPNDGHDIRASASNSQNNAKKPIQNFSVLTKTLLPLTSTTR